MSCFYFQPTSDQGAKNKNYSSSTITLDQGAENKNYSSSTSLK
jgi:hypothetical protein